jgi:hypothetical protein
MLAERPTRLPHRYALRNDMVVYIYIPNHPYFMLTYVNRSCLLLLVELLLS